MDKRDLELVPVRLLLDGRKYKKPLELDVHITIPRGEELLLPRFVVRAISMAERGNSESEGN